MATATTESEDLLILPQEDTNTLVLDKEATNEDIVAPSDNAISFGDEEISLDNSSLNITNDKEVKKDENTSDSLEITEELDLWSLEDLSKDDLAWKDSIEEIKNKKSDDLGFWDLSISESGNDSVWTMEDILEKAISDLDSRSESIWNQKKSEEDKKSDFKWEIKDLEVKIKEIQVKIDSSDERISELNVEQEMIEKNTKSLERMKKVNPVGDIASTTSKKIHNAKRKQA